MRQSDDASPERRGACKTGGEVQAADFGRFSLWRPTVVNRTGGSKWVLALPTRNPQGILRIRRIRELQAMVPEFVDRIRGSKWVSALPTGSRQNRALPGQVVS